MKPYLCSGISENQAALLQLSSARTLLIASSYIPDDEARKCVQRSNDWNFH